jgi:DNA-binding GntR family transcriptional regulator
MCAGLPEVNMTELVNPPHRFGEFTKGNHSLVEMAYQAIHDAILYGRIKPGTSLRQIDLAEELGISARTVREALSRLTAEGLVVHEQHHSIRVAEYTVADVEELYLMRAAIEGLAFEAAASRLTAQDLGRLKEIVRLATPSKDEQTVESARRYNREFHWIIIRASGKRQYMRILDQIWKTLFIYYFQFETDDCKFNEVEQVDISIHEAIVAALEVKDGKKARKLIEEHVLITFQYQSVQMREYSPPLSG